MDPNYPPQRSSSAPGGEQGPQANDRNDNVGTKISFNLKTLGSLRIHND